MGRAARRVLGRPRGRAYLWIAAAAVAISVAATFRSGARAQAPAPSVTFTKDVAPIVYEHCALCHRPEGSAPFSLLTYSDVRRRTAQIADVTASRYMPPWKPEPGDAEFIGERRLSDREIATLQRWTAAGAPEGDAAALPRLPSWPAGWQLGQPDLVITLPEYTLRPNGLDVFRNFVVPMPIAGAKYVRGFEFRPGSPAVHHANIRIDPTPASRRLDEADPAPGYEGLILRSADYPDGYFLGWTPGQTAPLAPKGFGWRANGGSDFVVQLHMRPTGKPERIQPSIGLFFTDEAPTLTPVMLRLGRQNIDIPPGANNYRSSDSYTLPVDAQVQAVQPHSHYRAREVTTRAALPDGTSRVLITIRRWDFEWQDVYRYRSPFWLPAGTRITTDYTFDNSAENPRNPESPPRRVVWGFRSSDEMGDVWLQVLTRSDAERRRLVDDFRPKASAEDVVGYEMQIRENPSNLALHDDAAILYLELGKPSEAAAHFMAVVKLTPDSAVAHHNLGTAKEAEGRFAEARAEYEAAVRLDPAYVAAQINLGNMMLREGRILDAEQRYREAVRLRPANAEAHNNLGRALTALGRRKEAIDELEEALRLRPAFAEAQFNAAEVLLADHRPREAIARYRRALEIQPDWLVCLVRLSWTLATDRDGSVRDPDEAIRLAERAVRIGGSRDPSTDDALGAAYASAGRFDAAVKSASNALEHATDAEFRNEVRDRIDLYRSKRPFVQ